PTAAVPTATTESPITTAPTSTTASPETITTSTATATIATPTTTTPSFWSRLLTYYDDHLPLIVTLWLMGVLILQLRFIGQLAFLQRVKNYGTERFPARLAPMLQELEDKLGITKPVRYLTSFRVSSPFTAGWLRPAVLFPGGLLGHLDEAQLRTIIAHELAHIKRYDFLVNLIQTMLCILFFYHPAAWWISARIDEEREHCCDDLAIEATGEPVGYARTLLQLKETELAKSSLAMGLLGKGDGFKDRITRLLSGYLGTGTYGEGFTTAVIIFCFMGLAITLSGQQVQEGADAGAMERTEAMGGPPPPPPPPPPPGPVAPTSAKFIYPQTEVEIARAVERIMRQFDEAASESATRFDLFMHAIREGDLELVDYMLEKENFDFTQTNEWGLTPLMLAASEYHPEVVRRLIDAGAKVNYVNDEGWTALIEAADEGSYASALVLLEAGADPNLKGPGNSRSALAMAASEGHTNVFALLVQNGADVFSVQGDTHPLHTAAEEGQIEAVRQLLQLDADVNITDEEQRTPLSYAAEEGNIDVVELLLQNGADANLAGQNGRTPLSYAAEEGMARIAHLLLRAGASPEAQDEDGWSPLDYAVDEWWDNGKVRGTSHALSAYRGDSLEGVISVLLKAGATSDKVSLDGETLRIIYGKEVSRDFDGQLNSGTGNAPVINRHTEVTNQSLTTKLVAAVRNDDIDDYGSFLKEGADLNGSSYDGYTALTMASRENHNIDTERLIRAGANPNLSDSRGFTPLTEAAKHNHFNVVRTLLQNGASADLADLNGRTAKQIALRDGSVRVLRLLNEAGASVTAKDAEGVSPLVSPAGDGDVEMLRYLLQQGANPNDGSPAALFVAAREGRADAVRILAEYGASLETRQDYYDNDFFRREVPGGGGTAALYDGGTPLMIALTQRSTNVVRALLVAGADVNAACNKVRYTGKKALEAWNAKMMTERELRKRYKLTYRAAGWTPLMEAAESGKLSLVKLLLDNGADVRRKTSEGTTAYDVALENGFAEIAALLR
ncbi:MAG: ankyrin repeat domain-containing protein, partial [Bacteroidota bacterium]